MQWSVFCCISNSVRQWMPTCMEVPRSSSDILLLHTPTLRHSRKCFVSWRRYASGQDTVWCDLKSTKYPDERTVMFKHYCLPMIWKVYYTKGTKCSYYIFLKSWRNNMLLTFLWFIWKELCAHGTLKRNSEFRHNVICLSSLCRWLAAGIDLYTMSTYQTNYGIAGAIVGGFSRFILGPRAVVAASILGFSLG